MDSNVFAPAAEAEPLPSRWPLREDVFAHTGEVAHGEPEDVTWRAGESGPAGQETGGLEAEGYPPGRYELELEGYGSAAESYELPANLAAGWDHEDQEKCPARPGYLCVQHVPLLDTHRGRGPDLILRWNASSVPEVIDVVVHLHGFWYAGMTLRKDIEPVSGLDLTPIKGAAGQGRSRPTLTVLPKGNDTGRKQKVRQKDGSLTDGNFNVFTFPGLTTPDGLTRLIDFSLGSFAAQLGGVAPRVGRRILTAHSGGGAALLQILGYCDPHQIHIFDALYQRPAALETWALRHIQQDRAALAGLDAAAASQYMATRGGALRVFYQAKGGTRTWSGQVRDAIAAKLDPALARWYRVEASSYEHFQIPRRYGWRVLADADADVPDAHTEPATHHEAESWGAAFQLATAEELEALWPATGQEVSEGEAFEAEGFEGEFQEEPQSEFQREEEPEAGDREGLLTHASEEALARLEPLAAEAEALGPDEENPADRSLTARLLEQSVLVAAIAAGQRSESVLTDRLFRLRHPEYKDKPIGKGDTAADAEWRQIRDCHVVPHLLTGPFLGPMHDWLATSPVGTDLRKGVAEGAVLSPLSITRRGLRQAPRRQPGSIAAIVVHNTSRGPANRSREGGYRRPAVEYALDHYLTGKEGFPHYVIDFNGTIYATCDERFVAWHAGWVHAGGAKLFRSGWTAPDWWSRVWSRQGAATPIDLLPKGANSPNYRTIGIELLLLPAMAYTPQQYKALARLIADIQQRNPDLQIPQAPSRALLGHEDFAPVTGNGGRADAHGGWDPGAHRDRPFFDWQRLWSEIQAFGGKGAGAPESLEAEAQTEAENREEAEGKAGEELDGQLEAVVAEDLAEAEFGEREAFPFAPGIEASAFNESGTRTSKMDRPAAIAEATAMINRFRSQTQPGGWHPSVDRKEVADRLLTLINNPDKVDQTGNGLCGEAAFFNIWLSEDPLAVARFGVVLYNAGSAPVGTKVWVRPRPSLRAQNFDNVVTQIIKADPNRKDKETRKTVAEWMMMSALRDANNYIFSYDGVPSNKWGVGSTDGEVADWLRATNLFSSVTAKTGGSEKHNFDHASQLVPGNDVIMISCDSHMLGNPKPAKISSDHWFVLRSAIIGQDGAVDFRFWSWGEPTQWVNDRRCDSKNFYPKPAPGPLQEAQFTAEYFGYLIAKR